MANQRGQWVGATGGLEGEPFLEEPNGYAPASQLRDKLVKVDD